MPTLNFMAEFADNVEDGRKRRSIRKRRKDGRDPKPGDRLYLYTGMRQKGCRKLGEAICTRVRPVEIDHMGVTLDGRKLYCGNAPAFEGGEQPENYDSDFARADGFGDFHLRRLIVPNRPIESQCVSGALANLLRVAAVQLPRLDPEDRSALRKYVERDMGAAR